MTEKSPKVDLEMVDIIDEEFNILYPLLKTEAHARGLLHKTVIAGLINSRGERALIRQASDRQDPGQYVNPMGGHVSSGEIEEDALRREVMEELGIEEFKHELVGKAIYNRPILGHQENHLFIVYDIWSDSDITLSEEADDYRWFTTDELKKELKENPKNFGPSYFFVLENFYPDLLS